LIAVGVIVAAGCQTPPAPEGSQAPGATAAGTQPSSVQPQPGSPPQDLPSPAPAASPPTAEPAGPAPGSPAAKSQAQKLALHAAELLQDGDEEAALTALEQAVALDAENRLAPSLQRQIQVDPVQALGAQSFAYTVARGESLSRVAQRFLGDLYQFYLLARYNGIKVPRLVQAGQVIRVPGKAPPAPVTTPAPLPPPSPATAPAPEPKRAEPEPVRPEPSSPPAVALSPAERPYQSAMQALSSGDRAKAQVMFAEAAKLDPGYRDAAARSESLRRELVQRHHRNALTAFHKQDMNTAIREWDRVLELEPGNQTARVNRQRAIDLSKRIQQIK
jgi:LysM repeat protein